jgi:SAM-dependent methyltransferase
LVAAIDISEGLIEIARRQAPEVDFRVGDVTRTELIAGSFDCAISSLVMHYLKDLEPFFAETARILRPLSGKFIFSFHHPINEVLKKESRRVSSISE